jgi:AcrR family transcriptional regulator
MSKDSEARLSASLSEQEGFVAPRYRSGQRSADALLEAGRSLLEQINYEGLSVNDLCKKAHLTTGAFYRRFEGKDAFFLALQRLALDDALRTQHALVEQFSDAQRAPATLEQASLVAVDSVRLWHLHHRGVLRASMQRRDHTSGGWQPFKEFARGFVQDIAAKMAALPELRAREDAAQRLTIGFQIVIGTMINSALNDPGPLRLDEAAMTEALGLTLALYASARATHDQ